MAWSDAIGAGSWSSASNVDYVFDANVFDVNCFDAGSSGWTGYSPSTAWANPLTPGSWDNSPPVTEWAD